MNPITILVVVAAASATAFPSLPVLSQYHAQDELGQYSYGYAGGPSSKHESRSLDGITRGAFSYVDSNGLIQSRSYVSDPVNGFRVAASDVPVGHPEALVAPAVHAVAAAPVVSTYTAAAAPVVSTYTASVPVVVPGTTNVVSTGLHSQYHSQDALGQYRYGYSSGSSAKDELKTADGITRGAFSYIDSRGLVQTRSYVADDANGFRVAASDLPVGPTPVLTAPAPVVAAAPVAVASPVVASPVPVAPTIPATPVDSSITGAVVAPAEIPAPEPAAPALPVPPAVPAYPVAPAEAQASDASSDSVVVDAV